MKATMTVLILSAVLLAAVVFFRPGWLDPEPQPEASAAAPLAELICPPDDRIALLLRRKTHKEEVVRRLFDGGLTLLEAAERFHLLNASPGGLEDVGWKSQPGGDDGERLCNQVLSWAEAVMPYSRPRSEVVARIALLRRELRDHVAMHGGVELPPVGAE